jgi:hypothetical protein
MQIQPQSLCFFALIAWGQTLVYHRQAYHCELFISELTTISHWAGWKSWLATFGLGAIFAAVEVLLVLTLRVCS